MSRSIYDPSISNNLGLKAIVPIKLGGTGATSAGVADDTLDVLSEEDLNIAQGVLSIGADGKIALARVPTGVSGGAITMNADGEISATVIPSDVGSGAVAVDGTTTAYLDHDNLYTISNYDSFNSYTVSATNGTVSRAGSIITYRPLTAGSGGFTVNGKVFTIPVAASGVVTPDITSPVNNATEISQLPTFTSSAFGYIGGAQTQDQVRWEVSAASNFATLTQYYEGTSNLTSWTVPTELVQGGHYYVRVKHHSVLGGWSAWSATIAFDVYVFQGWVRKFTATTSSEDIYGVATDSSNNVYVVGRYAVSSVYYAWISKWTPEGTFVWSRQVITPGGIYTDSYNDITIDRYDNIYVVGQSGGSSGEPGLSRWATDGTLVWHRRIPDSDISNFLTVLTDADGNIYTAGSWLTVGVPNTAGSLLVKWSPAGNILWQRDFTSTNENPFISLTLSESGNIYTVGQYNELEATLMCWDNDGTLLWNKRLNNSAYSKKPNFLSVTTDADGNIYAAGSEATSSYTYGLLTCWSPDGTLQWQRVTNSSNYKFTKVVVQGDKIYVAGTNFPSDSAGFISCWSLDGLTVYWKRMLDWSAGKIQFSGMSIDSNQDLYVAGTLIPTSGSNYDSILTKVPKGGSIPSGALTGSGMTAISWAINMATVTGGLTSVVSPSLPVPVATTCSVTAPEPTITTPALTQYFSEY